MLLFLERAGEGSVEIQMVPKPTLHPVPIMAVEFIEKFTASLDIIEEAKKMIMSEFKQDGNLIIQSLKKWKNSGLKIL